jgi:hypothetical protein
MNSLRLIALIVLAGHAVWAADGPAMRLTTAPPVLKATEPSDSVMVTLPGMVPRVAKLPSPPKPADKEDAVAPTAPAIPAPATVPPKPALELGKKALLPPDLQKEVAVFCQKLIGQWTEEDAEQLLGKALRQRPSFDEKKAVNGKIYAFTDPTGRYRELELDFEQANSTLRTVFAYPKWMTWQDCRKRWNGEVSEADAKQGRVFYSYINRRLDVLVDAKGRVISLGLY